MSSDEDDRLPAGLNSSSDDDDDESDASSVAPPTKSKKRKQKTSSKSSKKKKNNPGNSKNNSSNPGGGGGGGGGNPAASSMIDDAAVHSGSDGDSEDEDEDNDENNNDYINDGFVVDDEIVEKHNTNDDDDDLDDSDDDDDDDSDGGGGGGDGDGEKKRRRVRKGRAKAGLSQDDMDLIAESKGTYKPRIADEDLYDEDDDMVSHGKKAAKINDLRDELFKGGTGGGGGPGGGDKNQKKKQKQKNARKNQRNNKAAVDTFDEDAMDDFIDDDVGAGVRSAYRDDDDGMGGAGGVSEAQINEANDIFGQDFFNIIGGGDDVGGGGGGGDDGEDQYDEYGERRRRKFREPGVGTNLGVDSDDDILSESDMDDQYDSDDEMFAASGDEEMTSEERAAALRAKREKKRQQKEERRRKKADARKARLRRAFEPVQLIENFCTDRDDKIRLMDAPERFFDWKTPFHGPDDLKQKDLLMDGGSSVSVPTSSTEEREALWIVNRVPEIASEYAIVDLEGQQSHSMASSTPFLSPSDVQFKKEAIVQSVVRTLRFLHVDKLEPEFIRKYRADEVTSPAVRNNIYRIMDEDSEWERLSAAKMKVESILDALTETAEGDEALGADEEYVAKLKEDLKNAQDRLDESVRDEEKKKAEIDGLGKNNDEEDDDLFGDDDDEDDNGDKKKDTEEIAKQKESLMSHLKTTQSLVKVCAEQVSSIEASLKVAQENSAETQPGQENAQVTTAQLCRDKLWHHLDYKRYLSTLTDYTHIMDLYNYLTLLKEGNDAVRNKGLPSADDKKKKRSKRFDRDYYRTCVSQGLRRICYQFALSPFRAGIKLEDNVTSSEGFNWEKTLPGENPNSGDEDAGDPKRWNAPVVEFTDPTSFASDLVSSGELVLLATMNDGDDSNMNQDHPEVNDPLRGCRYVAAMELAYEPRIRKYLRAMYRKKALVTTRPTNKGIDTIDPFHEFYGLHLLRNKKVKDHFYPDEEEMEMETMGFTVDERKEKDEKVRNIQKQSCLQYMNVMKAEKSGHLNVFIHLPSTDDAGIDWYKKDDDYFNNRDRQDLSPFIEELKKVYYPTNGDLDEWNNQREMILRLSLKKFLLPFFEAEMRRELREASYKAGIKDAGEKLSTMAMEGPYRPSHLLGDNRFLVPTGDLAIVGVCCSSDGRDASYLVAVTERGEVSDHLAIPSGIQIDSGKIREKAITFLMQARPAAIVVGSHAGLSSRLVARKLGALTTEATERWNNRFIQGQDEDDDEYHSRLSEFRRLYPNHEDDDEDDIEWKCNVEMVDDNIAQLFGRSVRGKKEFPDAAVNQKCAISIARYAKDPLAEIAYTWSVASDAGVFGTEMLFLNVHSLQQLLPKTLLLREYERVICRAVADVGVDINLSCKYDHIHGLLTFIPGLGPRKAASLKQGIDRIGGVVVTRRDLLGKRLVGPVVYNNAVGFLRIRDIDSLSNQLLHPLDDTRLHPHVYHRNNWATKIAIDALEMDNDEATNSGNDDKAITAIRDIMEDSHNEIKRLFDATKALWERTYGQPFSVDAWDPQVNVPAESWRDKVEELDLETFADMIEKDGKGKWLSHLTMIKWEFRLPYEDPRRPMEPLEKEKLFRMLTGESDQTLCPGREVTGKVARISDFGAHLKLEGDVPAFIPLRNLSDGHVESAEDIVQVGQIVTAIVTEVKKNHMSVDLSLKDEDLKKLPSSWDRPTTLSPLDVNFDSSAARQIEKDKTKEREDRLAKMNALLGAGKSGSKSNTAMGRTGKVTSRACGHPAFRNKNINEVENELKESGVVGEALIRPSKSNADSLSLHWLVREGVSKIIEIIEEDKDNDASIGNTLKVKNETFGSLDELLARYIAPMNDHVEQLIEHEKFRSASEKDVDNELLQLRQKNPRRAAYLFCWNEKFAGYASLRFIVNKTPRSHHVGITPEGYFWCHKTFPDLNYLLNEFKKNPSGAKKSANTDASRNSSSRQSRWSSRGSTSSTQRQPPQWAPPPSQPPPSGYNRPPPSLPPPPQHAYPPPPPPGNGGWQQQRPPPPSLPPPPQNRYPPAPPQ